MRPDNIFSSLLFLAAVSTAWQPLEAVKRDLYPLVARQRQETTSFDLSFSAQQGNTATTEERTKETGKSDNNNDASSASITASSTEARTTDDGKNTGKETTTGKETGKETGKQTTKYETTKTFDARLPPGGVSMITPAVISGPQYYKVGDYVTFAWNYTSLSVTPTAIDVLASCSFNSATYTLAMNQTVDGPTGALTWDTHEYEATATLPLVVATYTLIIYDSDSSVTEQARAGYLGAYSQFTFGMYTPRAYTPISDYVCATCNGAISSMERHTLLFLLGMVGMTVLSFGWFAGVAGLW